MVLNYPLWVNDIQHLPINSIISKSRYDIKTIHQEPQSRQKRTESRVLFTSCNKKDIEKKFSSKAWEGRVCLYWPTQIAANICVMMKICGYGVVVIIGCHAATEANKWHTPTLITVVNEISIIEDVFNGY